MATSDSTALQRERLRQSGAERRELLKLAGSLTKIQVDALSASIKASEKTRTALLQERAKRGSSFSALASRYDTARATGTAAAKIRAGVEMAKLAVNAPIEFAKAAYMPDYALLDNIQRAVPAGDGNTQDPAIARQAWQTFLNSPRAMAGNLLGTYREMVRVYGQPATTYFGAADGPLAQRWREFEEKKRVAQENANEAELRLQGIGQSWNSWLSQNPGIDPESDAAMDMFLRDTRIDLKDLPDENSEYVQSVKKVAANPAAHPQVFSDIDAMLEKEEARTASLRAEQRQILADARGDPAKPAVDDSLQAKLAAWVRRPDVQWWAKEHGFNLGNAIEVTPDIQAEIDAGRYPDSMVINGMLYNPSPDDMRALRFADAQLRRDPQKNLLYAAGLTRDERGPRRIVEVEVAGEAPRAVQGAAYANGDKTGTVVKLSDGTYRAQADGDTEWKQIPREAGEALMAQAADVADIDMEIPGVPPGTRTVRMEYRGPQFGKDPVGSVSGINLETGEFDTITQDKIVRKTFIGADSSPRTLGERINAASARATAKREGLDLTTEAQNEEDIGEKPTAAQQKASREGREAATAEKPDRAARAADKVADRAEEEAERVRAVTPVADVGKRNFVPQLSALKRIYGADQRAQATRQEANAATEGLRPGVKTVPDGTLYENMRSRPSSDAFVRQQEQRSLASEGTEPTETYTLEGARDLPGKVLPPYQGRPKSAEVLTTGDDNARDWSAQRKTLPTAAPAATSTKAPEVTTPTKATTPDSMEAQRRIFQRTRNPGGGAASGMVQ